MSTVTKLADMINPEVMADMISAELENAIRFAPLAEFDRTLVGQPGSKITLPYFKYIGDATDVAEGIAMDIAKLETDSNAAEIKKAARGVEITDEVALSGYGDPVGEAEKQLLLALASKVDNDLVAAALDTELAYTAGAAWNLDTIESAMDIFGDEENETMLLIMNSKDATKLRKAVAASWDRASDLGDQIIVSGVYGGVLGAQVVRSNRVARGHAVLIKPGALKVYLKREAMVEPQRDAEKGLTLIAANQHYVAHLYDESKVVKIIVASETVPGKVAYVNTGTVGTIDPSSVTFNATKKEFTVGGDITEFTFKDGNTDMVAVKTVDGWVFDEAEG